MLGGNSATFSNKRATILGQFQKAINGLEKLNESIAIAADKGNERLRDLNLKIQEQNLEQDALKREKEANEKTIAKMKEFVL